MSPRSRPGRVAVGLIVAALLPLAVPAIVAADAGLVSTTPADGEMVLGTPEEISATFDETLSSESTLSIRNAAGQRLAIGGLDPANATRLVIDPVPDLAAGAYEIRWSAFSQDGHLVKDTWSFTVAAPPPTKVLPTATAGQSSPPAPSETPTASPSAVPTPSASPAPGSSTGSGIDVILPIIAALAIVTIGAGFLLSRGRRGGSA